MVGSITGVHRSDLRFPTSREADGSDAMNLDPDYSAAYVVISTNVGGLEGHGFVFTIGRGNDVQVGAIRALIPYLIEDAWTASSTTWAASGAGSSTTHSCAGSGPRKASCTWPSEPWSTPCGT